jgi:GTP cyclohydrolase II
MMEKQAIKVVERVTLKVCEGEENSAYIATNEAKSCHL